MDKVDALALTDTRAFGKLQDTLRAALRATQQGVWSLDVAATNPAAAAIIAQALNTYLANGNTLMEVVQGLAEEVKELRRQAGDLLAYRPGKGWESVLKENQTLRNDLATLQLKHTKLQSQYRALAAAVCRASGIVVSLEEP